MMRETEAAQSDMSFRKRHSFAVIGLLSFLALLPSASAHGWVTSPVSKNEMSAHHFTPGMPDDFRWEPQTSNHGNGIGNMGIGKGYPCGADDETYTKGLNTWQQWYNRSGVDVPRIIPGEDLEVNVTLTIDHGGQAWMMVACAETIAEDNSWTLLERSTADRAKHFMPSSPAAFAWAPLEYQSTHDNKMSTVWAVPQSVSCPSGHMVGRWVWKTGNSCNDFNNIGRKTEAFKKEEFADVVHAYHQGAWVDQACTSPPETFISCLDFVIGNGTGGSIIL